MNIYVVVEGLTERIVYPSWIKLLNPNLNFVLSLSDISENDFSVITGGGYPKYFDVIEDAIEDTNIHGSIDRLIISADSESFSHDEKAEEFNHFLEGKECTAEVRIVVQHFCLEAWALGNRIVNPRHPKTQCLKDYRAIFDVGTEDPEALPANDLDELNRAQFAEKYLRAIFNDRRKNLTYSKNNPRAIMHSSYFERIQDRYDSTDHLRSFEGFLNAFMCSS